MKITAIRAHVLEAPIADRFAFSQAWVDRRVGLVVEVETDTGITGWGDGYGPPWALATVIEKLYAPRLIGRSPWPATRCGRNCTIPCAITVSAACRSRRSRPSTSRSGTCGASISAPRSMC